MVVVLLRPLRPLQRPDLVAGHEHALLPAHKLQLRVRLQLGEAALVAVGDGGAAARLDYDARHLAVTAEHAPQVVQGEGGALVAPHRHGALGFYINSEINFIQLQIMVWWSGGSIRHIFNNPENDSGWL